MERRKNILFFFTDDQRFDTICALGNKQIHTPNMDRLVERGISFTRAHIMGGTSDAVCMPSRSTMLTGRSLFQIEGEGQSINPEHTTLGEHFRRNGYTTHGIGKWHNGKASYRRSFTGGAEIYFGGMCDHWNVPAYHYDPSGKYESTLPICKDPWTTNEVIHREADHIRPGKHSSELLCDAAIDFLDTYNKEDPFFLYISFLAPHDPRTMPEQYLKMYDPEEIELPPNFMGGHPFDNGELKIRDELLEEFPRAPEAIKKHLAEYYGMITHADAEMGRVMEALEKRGELDNTIIVFAGDNGLALGQHGLMGKQNLYEHSVRVPLIFAGPGVPEGRQSDSLCYLIDIFPTLCTLLDLETPETVEGKDLVPAMAGETARDHLHLAYRHLMRGVTDGHFKLIETVVNERRTTQFFDLQADPWELTNLADHPDHKERRAAMSTLLATFRSELGDTREQGRIFWRGYDASTAEAHA